MKKPNHALKKLRKLLGKNRGYHLGQQEFAKSLGVSRDTITGIETGRLKLSQKMKNRIKAEYEVTISEDGEDFEECIDNSFCTRRSKLFKELGIVDSDANQFATFYSLKTLVKTAFECWIIQIPPKKREVVCIELIGEMTRILKKLTGNDYILEDYEKISPFPLNNFKFKPTTKDTVND